MREAYEAELRIALAEGLLSKEDADALLEEALRLEEAAQWYERATALKRAIGEA